MTQREFLMEFLQYVEVKGEPLSLERKQLLIDQVFESSLKDDGNNIVEYPPFTDRSK